MRRRGAAADISRMPAAMPFDPLEPLQQEEIRRLFASVAQWNRHRWRTALATANDATHRAQRATSRLLCDAVLAVDRDAIADWLVRDLARTAAETLGPTTHRARAAELLEDAALALLARSSLAMADQAVLLRPCLPFTEPNEQS